MESLYTAIAIFCIFVCFIIFVCLKLVVSTSRAEENYGVRPELQRIELSDNIHPRQYNVSSQRNRSELLEAARLKVFDQALIKEEIRRNSSSCSLNHLSETSHCQNCEAEKRQKRSEWSEQSLISNSYFKSPYHSISEVYENGSQITENL